MARRAARSSASQLGNDFYKTPAQAATLRAWLPAGEPAEQRPERRLVLRLCKQGPPPRPHTDAIRLLCALVALKLFHWLQTGPKLARLGHLRSPGGSHARLQTILLARAPTWPQLTVREAVSPHRERDSLSYWPALFRPPDPPLPPAQPPVQMK